MGNCTLLNVPVAVASDREGSGPFRQYGTSDGLLGLHEMVQYGAVLDLGNRLLFVRPAGPSQEIAAAAKSILTRMGYTAVDLSVARSCLRAPRASMAGPVTCSSTAAHFSLRLIPLRLPRHASAAFAPGWSPKASATRAGGFQSRSSRACASAAMKSKAPVPLLCASVPKSSPPALMWKWQDCSAWNTWGEIPPSSISIPARFISSRNRLVRQTRQYLFPEGSGREEVSKTIHTQSSRANARDPTLSKRTFARSFAFAQDDKLRRFLLIQRNESRAQSSKARYR